MNAEERPVILDRDFDLALTAVLDAFLQEGFFITPAAAGDLHRPGVVRQGRRRYASIDVTPTDAISSASSTNAAGAHASRVSVFELGGTFTMVMCEHAADRAREVVRTLRRTGAPRARARRDTER